MYFIIKVQTNLSIISSLMRRQSRDIKSKEGRQSSNGQRSRRRSKRSSLNDSSFIFSEIPRAAFLPQSSGEIAFNKIVSSRSNLFEPATSECDYQQFRQNQPIKSQRFFDDKASLDNSSKREKFWRVLQRNNDDDSVNSSDGDSQESLERTSRRWSKTKRSKSLGNQRITIQEQPFPLQPQEATQQYNLPKGEEVIAKKQNYFSISNKEVDFKVTPKRENKRQEIITDNQNTMQNSDLLAGRMVGNQTAEKRVNVAQVQRKKPKVNLLHQKMKRRERESDDVWVQKLKYFNWDQAQFLHQFPRQNRKNNFPFRKTRMSPLQFWKGQRIVYKNNRRDGIWVNIEK